MGETGMKQLGKLVLHGPNGVIGTIPLMDMHDRIRYREPLSQITMIEFIPEKQVMDYGDRQDRALMLVKALREQKDQSKVVYTDYRGQVFTAKDIADYIEEQSDLGRSIVATAGLVIQCLKA